MAKKVSLIALLLGVIWLIPGIPHVNLVVTTELLYMVTLVLLVNGFTQKYFLMAVTCLLVSMSFMLSGLYVYVEFWGVVAYFFILEGVVEKLYRVWRSTPGV